MTISLHWNSSWAALKLERKKHLMNNTVTETLQIILQQHSKNFSEHLLCVRHCYYWHWTYCWMKQRYPCPQETYKNFHHIKILPYSPAHRPPRFCCGCFNCYSEEYIPAWEDLGNASFPWENAKTHYNTAFANSYRKETSSMTTQAQSWLMTKSFLNSGYYQSI